MPRYDVMIACGSTLPKTNIVPENGWLEDNISFWDGLFSGAMFVSGKVKNTFTLGDIVNVTGY